MRLLRFLLLLALFIAPAVAQDSPNAVTLVTGIPPEYLQFPQIIYYVILPSFAVAAITMGFIQTTKLFSKTPYVAPIIAITVALLALFSEVTWTVVYWIFVIMGPYSVGLFALIFLIGTVMWGLGRYREWKIDYAEVNSQWLTYRHGVLKGKLKRLESKRDKTPEDFKKIDDLREKIAKIENNIEYSRILAQAKKEKEQKARTGQTVLESFQGRN